MKKIIIFAAVVLFFSQILYADPQNSTGNTDKSYELYVYEEFPDWMHKIRRAESLFIGSIPLTFAAVSLVGNVINGYTSTPLTQPDYLIRFGFSAAISAVLVIIDFILGELENE